MPLHHQPLLNSDPALSLFIFGPVLGSDFAILWSTVVNSRALPTLSVVLTLSYHSWFTADFLEYLWDVASGFILFFIINYSKVMLTLCGFCATLMVIICYPFLPLIYVFGTSHLFGFPVWWRILDHGKGTILNLNHDFRTSGMCNVDNALNVYVNINWAIFYLNFKYILYILVYSGGFPPPPNEASMKNALVSTWILTWICLF